MFTAQQVKAAIKETLAKERAAVVQSWADETDPQARDQLWHKFHAIDSIEETIEHDFTGIIERAAGISGDADPTRPGQ
jgi:hypothetical protein